MKIRISASPSRKAAEEIARKTGHVVMEIGPVKMVGTEGVNRFMRLVRKAQTDARRMNFRIH